MILLIPEETALNGSSCVSSGVLITAEQESQEDSNKRQNRETLTTLRPGRSFNEGAKK